MGIFPGFGGWINQNIQQPLMAEDVNSSSIQQKDSNIQEPWYWVPNVDPKQKARLWADAKKYGHHVRSLPMIAVDPKYYDYDEVIRQTELWTAPNNKHPWNDAPAKVKATTEKGICHLQMEYTLSSPPQEVEELLTNPRDLPIFSLLGRNLLSRLSNESTKVLKKDGPRQITQVEKTLRWEILKWAVGIPIHLIIDENHQTLTATYKKEKMMYMKVFEGSWKVEPLYVDQERFCKSRSQISEKEYRNCSNGKGRIASKVTMEHIFQPAFLLNVPPVSWLIREITIKTTKDLLEDLRKRVIKMNKN